MSITVVTVTYGRRSHLLVQALDAAKAQGVAEAVVIDNGSAEPIAEIVAARYGAWAHVQPMGTNQGSARGFKAGIELALSLPGEYLLLLDDDNVAGAGCVATLQAAFIKECASTAQAFLIGFAFRADRHQWMVDQARGLARRRRRSSFRGFHVLDIFDKIAKRMRLQGKYTPSIVAIPATIRVTTAAYGGMYFHRSLIGTIGLPDEKFFLYEDDTEYTSRVITKGGRILLVTGARVYDCDTSWNLKNAQATSFSRLLDPHAHTRLFYAFRNGTFLDFRVHRGNRLVVLLNLAVYMAILLVVSVAKVRLREFGLASVALFDGITGNFSRKPHDDLV